MNLKEQLEIQKMYGSSKRYIAPEKKSPAKPKKAKRATLSPKAAD